MMFKLVNQNHDSVRSAASKVVRTYPKETISGLRRHFQRSGGKLVRTDGRQRFTNLQEDTIVGVIEAFSLANAPLSRVLIIRMVRKKFKLSERWRGDDWYLGFIARHHVELHVRHPRELSARRADPSKYTEVEHWVERIGSFLEEHTFSSETVYNADETLIHVIASHKGTLRVEAASKRTSNMKLPKGMHYGSIILFSNAAGQTPLVVIVLPVQFGTANAKETDLYLLPTRDITAHRRHVMYAFSEKGYMTNALFKLVVDRFRAVIKERHPDLEHLLYLDRLGAHLQPDVVRSCLAEKLYTVWFPSYTSEFLQPEDAQEFAAFHDVLNSVRRDYDPSALTRGRPAHAVAMDFVAKALDACTTKGVVKLSFASTGIFPWDPDLILSHARIFTSRSDADDDLSSNSDPIKLAQGLAAAVIEEHDKKSQAVKHRARVWNNRLYLPEEVLQEAEQRDEDAARVRQEKADRATARLVARERKAAEKEERKRKRQEEVEQQAAAKERRIKLAADKVSALSCKSCGRRCRNEHSPHWRWCDYCDTFGVCPYRNLCPDGLLVLEEHEEEEAAAGKRPLHALLASADSPAD